jgi:hypothetical protein
VDDIFTYMIHELKVNDFMKLSDPNSCHKYVLFMANNLSIFFKRLSIIPKLGKDGVLAFQSIDELEEPPKEDAKKEKESLCLLLAYFYTRIFQIYGAIALTLLDDVNYTVDNVITTSSRPGIDMSQSRSLLTPGQDVRYVQPRKITPLYGVDNQRGGGITDLGAFDFFNSDVEENKILIDAPTREYQQYQISRQQPWQQSQILPPTTRSIEGYSEQFGYMFNYTHDGKKSEGTMYFKMDSDRRQDDPRGGKKNKGTLTWTKDSKSVFTIDVTAELDGNKKTTFTIQSIVYYVNKGTQRKTMMKDEIKEDLAIQSVTIENGQVQSTPPQPVKDYLSAIFKKIIKHIKAIMGSDTTTASKSTIDVLDIRRFYQNYSVEKPLAHCVARALQLLKVQPYGEGDKNKQLYSSICNYKFFHGKSDERKGIPIPNQEITKSPGILSLALLFYDTVGKATPHLFMSPKSFEDYKIFMKKMAELFMPKDAATLQIDTMKRDSMLPKTVEDEQKETKITTEFGKSDKQIKDKRLAELCKDEKEILLTPATKNNVEDVVRQLFKRQLDHAAKCEVFLRKLFTIQYKDNLPLIKINDNILRGGLAALNQINAEARAILVQYYSDCETMYIKGTNFIVKQEDGIKAEKARVEAVAKAQQNAVKAQQEAAEKAKKEAEEKAQKDATEKARVEAVAKAQQEAAEKAKKEAAQKAALNAQQAAAVGSLVQPQQRLVDPRRRSARLAAQQTSGGTRKHTTSSPNMTRRLARQ